MNETEFNALAEGTLASVVRALESSGVDCDCEFKGDGVLELEFENHSKIIVNRHAPAKEVWVAAKSGGYHYRFDGARWVNTRDGEALFATLSRCVSEQSGSPVVLSERI
ncbi:MAG: iron donor protein CyaY [Betaproteobacteria bacterium RBG_16_64_18]|nr:MAG: iron donor protein CyaY [Betaproteobacteria bacterium RBG_16_64_18]OGA12857.1 MAG: iron donor protein CyaY [Betaproteobacteria bacterium RIFCSPLOWO2_02_FULL_65_20]OGA37791.1 MAG: iron donor protein CyaY [Betaproteobacteria bacterium RIFCSPLOWO2_12_FULL_65_110]